MYLQRRINSKLKIHFFKCVIQTQFLKSTHKLEPAWSGLWRFLCTIYAPLLNSMHKEIRRTWSGCAYIHVDLGLNFSSYKMKIGNYPNKWNVMVQLINVWLRRNRQRPKKCMGEKKKKKEAQRPNHLVQTVLLGTNCAVYETAMSYSPCTSGFMRHQPSVSVSYSNDACWSGFFFVFPHYPANPEGSMSP